jgi:lysophospholipase L1-like esterase
VRLRLFLAITGLVVLALVATAAVRLSGNGDTSEPEPAATDDAALPPGPVATYVALGDSYTAGPLIRWMRSDPPTCLRSTRNYPAVLAQWLEVDDLVDVSCSGADTGNITASQSWFGRRAPAQLSAVTADSDLVTLGVGGNDADLFSSLVAGARPPGLPVTLERVSRRVSRIVAAIRARAPAAVIAVVGYPRIVPERGTCAALPFDARDNRYLNRVERALNAGLRRAAGDQAIYVDTYGPSLGHDICARDAWVNGGRTRALEALAYHPFASGMWASATAIHRALRGGPPPLAARQQARAALAPRPADALTRREQRFTASLLGG